jgi:hypothetical protein
MTNARSSSHAANARGAALVAAAIGIRRLGFTSAIPCPLLERYLDDPEHSRVPREAAEAAWGWATRLRRATTFMLHPAGEHEVEVFDYLVDAVQNRSRHWDDIPDAVIRAAIADAGYAAAESIATAYAQNRYFLAAEAWRQARQVRRQQQQREWWWSSGPPRIRPRPWAAGHTAWHTAIPADMTTTSR